MSALPVRLLYCGDVQTATRPWRDAGLEVIVLEPGVSPAQLAAVAVQEDVGLVAVTDADMGAAAVDLLEDDVVVFWVTSGSGPS
jgi:hypothetical protein